ncbi:hypothetical protein PIB30_067746 [Stylosanthes scabra]|uniref:Uncharacterized protein n=1 Tax=Stylosanthes scabra TaxID=79078 RepID=A0ABU6XNF0_9FABA|nr:hypothetical protein [Stylosanthes scabra]
MVAEATAAEEAMRKPWNLRSRKQTTPAVTGEASIDPPSRSQNPKLKLTKGSTRTSTISALTTLVGDSLRQHFRRPGNPRTPHCTHHLCRVP